MAISNNADALGKRGEHATALYLEGLGYRIIARNWRIKEGELDLVAIAPEGEVVFTEVKTRSSNAFGNPLEAISREKLWRIQRLALAWLATNQRLGARYRIDVSGVLLGRSGDISIDYRIDVS